MIAVGTCIRFFGYFCRCFPESCSNAFSFSNSSDCSSRPIHIPSAAWALRDCTKVDEFRAFPSITGENVARASARPEFRPRWSRESQVGCGRGCWPSVQEQREKNVVLSGEVLEEQGKTPLQQVVYL